VGDMQWVQFIITSYPGGPYICQ